MHKNIPLVVGITILFLGLAIQPSIATVQPDEEIIDVEPKAYLFQTIIDISNNPYVKSKFEQYGNNLVKVDVDRSIYHKTFFRNPRLLFQLIFTKPSMSHEYLNFAYNQGIKIINNLDEDNVIEMVESIKVTNPQLLDEILNIIMDDEVLDNKIETLKIVNKELKQEPPLETYPILCAISMFTLILYLIISSSLLSIGDIIEEILPFGIFSSFLKIIYHIDENIMGLLFIAMVILCGWPI